ncbi:MAG: hypothetical protein MJ207_01140 [Bacilli bacterium]|nr:hypothetical protein [Bacilli bacterium]
MKGRTDSLLAFYKDRLTLLFAPLIIISTLTSCNKSIVYTVNKQQLWDALELKGVKYLQVQETSQPQTLYREFSPTVYHEITEQPGYYEYYIEKDSEYKYERNSKDGEFRQWPASQYDFGVLSEYSEKLLKPIKEDKKEYEDFIYNDKTKEYRIDFSNEEYSLIQFVNYRVSYFHNWTDEGRFDHFYQFTYKEVTPPLPKVK